LVQAQLHGPVPLTLEAVPCAHKFEAGPEPPAQKVWLTALPQRGEQGGVKVTRLKSTQPSSSDQA
jgi:hypothetical protein